MVKQIFTLCGKHFEVTESWDLHLEFPEFKEGPTFSSYNRDRLSNDAMILVNNKDKWYQIQYIPHLNMYVCTKLKYIGYNPVLDIKFEWKYGKELKEWYDKNT